MESCKVWKGSNKLRAFKLQSKTTTVFQLKSQALKNSICVNLKREKLNFTPNLRIKQIERLVDPRVHKNVLRPATKTKK